MKHATKLLAILLCVALLSGAFPGNVGPLLVMAIAEDVSDPEMPPGPQEVPYVYLDPNGGSCNRTMISLKYSNHYIGEALPVPERPGYDFVGWWVDGNDYANRDMEIAPKSTLRAVWVDSSIFSARKNGWPIPNLAVGFGYGKNTIIDWIVNFSDVYNITIPSLFYLDGTIGSNVLNRIFTQFTNPDNASFFSGFCFGMSLLAALQYEGKADLSGYFPRTGNGLHSYGYNNVVNPESSQQTLTVSGNSGVIREIKNAQIMQFAKELEDVRVFKNDTNFSNLVKYFQEEKKPHPLVVYMNVENYVHGVVIDPSIKPVKSPVEDCYDLYLYDPNTPIIHDAMIYSNVDDPAWYYQYADRNFLRVNTRTDDFSYFAYAGNGIREVRRGKIKGFFNEQIKIYNPALLSNDILSKKLSIWKIGPVALSMVQQDIEIEDENGDVIFAMDDDGVSYCAEDCDYDIEAMGSESPKSYVIFHTAHTKLSYRSKPETSVLLLNEGMNSMVATDGDARVTIDAEEKSVRVSSDESVGVKGCIQINEGDGYKAYAVETALDGGHLLLAEDTVISDQDIAVSMSVETDASDNIENIENVPLSDLSFEGIVGDVTYEIKTAQLPGELVNIEAKAFEGCDFTHIYLGEHVERIGARAFAGCSDLRYIEIPDSVKEIDPSAFEESKRVVIVCGANSAAARFAQDNQIEWREKGNFAAEARRMTDEELWDE